MKLNRPSNPTGPSIPKLYDFQDKETEGKHHKIQETELILKKFLSEVLHPFFVTPVLSDHRMLVFRV